MKDPIADYLSRYAEPEAANAAIKHTYAHCLVVPAYDEAENFLQQLLHHQKITHKSLPFYKTKDILYAYPLLQGTVTSLV